MRMRKWILVLLALLTACSFLWAGGQGAAEKPTIRIAHQFKGGIGGDFGKWFPEALDEWAAEHSELATYVQEAEQGDNLRNKIKLDLAANNLPDIVAYWSLQSLMPMIEEGLLADVKEYFTESTATDWEDYYESALNDFKYQGKYYAIPSGGFKDYYMCNRELFQKYGLEYPKTYEDLLAVSKKFAANGIIPLSVGSKGGNPAHFLFGEMYYQVGSLDYMNKIKTGETSFNHPLVVQTAERVLEMARGGVFPKDTIGSGDFQPAVALYNDEKAAMILAQTWAVWWFKEDIVKKSDLIFFPKIKGAKNDPSTFCVGNVNGGWNIKKESWDDPAKRRAIIAVMDWIVSDEVLRKGAESGGGPLYKKVDLTGTKVPLLASMVNDFTKGQASWTNLWSQMPDPVSQEVFSVTLDELWAQNISAQDFVTKVTASIEKALK